MENSSIEWTDHTFNPWWGCIKVSDGCKNCYAETLDNRWKGGHWGPNSPRREMSEDYWKKPFQWNKAAEKAGIQAKVFCASMADVFEDHPHVVEWRYRLLDIIGQTPNLIWQLLTKRPENINRLAIQWKLKGFPENVWIGTSVENQKAADERIPFLLMVPAAVRFLSCEPLLGNVEFSDVTRRSDYASMLGKPALHGIHWVIAGGESGHGARPMHPDWARSLRDQCASVGVPFFFKQWGEWEPVTFPKSTKCGIGCFTGSYFRHGENLNPEVYGMHNQNMHKVGKKLSGSLLDGKEHKEFPA